MQKLKLRIEDLAVESFRTATTGEMRGTVQALESGNCSYGSPGFTGCRLSCGFPCGESGGCTDECPGGGGGTNGGACSGNATHEASCNTACRLSCAFPC